MKCIFCLTEIAVDGDKRTIECPQCGCEFDADLPPTVDDGRGYGENERYETPEND